MVFTNYYRGAEQTAISQDSIADGDYIIDLVSTVSPPNFLVDYFYFVNGAGDQVDASAGTVVITMSSGQDIYNDINGGSFNADQARVSARAKPNGVGFIDKVKITLSSVSGTGITGFRARLSQFT